MLDDIWYLHQTPESVAKKIISEIVWKDGEQVYEPYAGLNAFFDNLPDNVVKYRTEIEDGLDYLDFNHEEIKIDTVITNPPFKIDGKNVFFKLLLYFAKIPHIKRIIFFCSAVCFESLTPRRMKELWETGMDIQKMSVFNIKKWKGRYFAITFERKRNNFLTYDLKNYD
jgi:hypothetical protein